MKPIWKWMIGIVACLLVIVAAGGWYLSRHWKPILETRLRQAVVNATDSLYQIHYDEVDFNVVTGNASITNLQLIPDTQVYARRVLEERAPDNIYNIMIADLRIRQFHPRRILRERKLHINDIIIDTPSIHVMNEYHAYNHTAAKSQDSLMLYQRISNMLNEVSVENIQFNDIQFKFSMKTDSVVKELALRNINLTLRDILIDSLSQVDTSRLYYARGIDLDMPGFRHETADSFYYVSFDRLQVATAEREVVLTGLKYAPRMNRSEFYRRKKEAKDMAIISLPHIRFEHIDLHRFVNSQKIYAGSLHIDSGTVAISNDLRYPKRLTNKIGKSPHQLLLKLKQHLKIDSVLIDGVDVSYAEISKKHKKEGKITFDRVNGIIRNVTNDSSALIQNNTMEADLTTYVMNTGKLTTVFAFDMLDKHGAFTYRGRLGPMNGKPFNQIMTPLLNAEIASANIEGLHFDVKADDHRARGSLQFDYNKMKLNLIASDNSKQRSSMKVASFLTNSFIINDSNPDANGKYHTGRINYARPHTYSFFKTLTQSLLQGIKECAGISEERERRLMNTAEEAKKASEKTEGFFKRVFGKKKKKD
ncbi:hypothetical protein [Parapedobacter tibetensis]|uniref:hypothetical protein n=1 Tax=Parapedobacter tibetensis TaxID=2972951 RepID=UPI00214DE000|nr:hypothetical protein [Parapedobacter tibetensis]